VFLAAFLLLQFAIVIFGARIVAQKLLVKCALRFHSLLTVCFCNFLAKKYGAKAARNMLLKLTTGHVLFFQHESS